MSGGDASTGSRPLSRGERRLERLRQVERWLRYAREDLDAAKDIAGDPRAVPRHACFLSQQAAEKAIKAGLVFLSREVPRRHDLDGLLQRLPKRWTVVQEVKARALSLATLTEWAVEARYSGDLPDANEGDAREAVEIAGQVYLFITRDLESRGYRPIWDFRAESPVNSALQKHLDQTE